MHKKRSIEDLVSEHPFVKDVDPIIFATLAGCCRNIVFRTGDLICREGEPADHFYLIRSGQVALETFIPGRGGFIFHSLAAGDCLGLSWLVPPYLWDYDARVIETVRALAFDAQCLRDKSDADPKIGYAFLKQFIPMLVDRLRCARLQALDLYSASNTLRAL
ncbi:MAG: cyclic nucleotide-binding domain-containing protein [Rhodospirillaceae bacterium]